MGRTSDAKERLLKSAIDLIYSRSYAGVSVQDICEHADVKKGSFHYFFKTKRDLALAALEQQWDLLNKTVLERAFSQTYPPLERIQRYFKLAYQYQRLVKDSGGQMYGCHFGNLAIELSTQDGAIREKIAQIFEKIASYIEKALRDAVAAGDLDEIDTKLSAYAVLGYFEGIILLAKSQNNPELIKRLSQSAVMPSVLKDSRLGSKKR
ncbi:MAG: TetR/AcrR family transcriptional regulator [Ignavibacteriales bacterium]|nr:TetR/AcrR family transcriptional regulator [Ignavibacteriales bacterium]